MLKAAYRSLLCLILAATTISGCSKPDVQPLRLGTNVWPGYEPLYLARELGKFPGDKIKLIEYPSASEVIRAFRNRALEAASLTLDEVLMLVEDDIPIKVILVHDISNGADTILARPGIESMQDIGDKRVAVESSALGAFMISRALELHALSVADVDIRHLEVNAHEQAYLDDEVDVVVNFEPVRTRLLNQGANEIFTSREIYGEIVDVMIVHEDIYENRKEAIGRIVKNWFSALAYFNSNQQKAATIMAKRLNVSPDEVIAGFDGLELPDERQNSTMLGGEKPSLELTIARLEKVLKENGLINNDTLIPDILRADFIKN
jgi:NitT/TauT family transport system substrate-binding protein